MIKIKIKLLHDDAMLPVYAHDGDAGMDLFAYEDVSIPGSMTCDNTSSDNVPKHWALVKTGISIELPENTEAQVRSRSGMALKFGISVLNSPGTIDSGYRGEVGVILINHGLSDYKVKKGDKIAQMVIAQNDYVEVEYVNELSDTKRGAGGFGSTGN